MKGQRLQKQDVEPSMFLHEGQVDEMSSRPNRAGRESRERFTH